MTKQEIIDVIFKDPQIIKNLKDNKLEECITYIQSELFQLKAPQGYPSIEYIFLDVLDQAGIDILKYITVLDRDKMLFAVTNDLSKYTNLLAVPKWSLSNFKFQDKVVLPNSIWFIGEEAFIDSEFDKGLYINSDSLRVVSANTFGRYGDKLKYPVYIDDIKMTSVSQITDYLRSKGVDIF